MGRSHVTPIQQPDSATCGPSSLKIALQILGVRRSLAYLMKICKTNRNGTSSQNLIRAINKLGFSALVVEYATLHHLQSALRYPSNQVRAVLVSYLYELDDKDQPHPDSGHWAVVSSYHAHNGRIALLDSATGRKKSYNWANFRSRWMDYDLRRKKVSKRGRHFRLVRRWQQQLLMVIAKNPHQLPKFKIATARVFAPAVSF